MNFQSLSFRDIYRQELARVLESNDCHNPSGPGGGQFCSGSGGGRLVHDAPGFSAGKGAAPTAATPKKVKHKLEHPGPNAKMGHIANYRGMEIHTLNSYITPYYYVNAPGFGSFHHTPSLTRIKRQIDTFKDTGETAHRTERRKASERYQKKKRSAEIRAKVRAEMYPEGFYHPGGRSS